MYPFLLQSNLSSLTYDPFCLQVLLRLLTLLGHGYMYIYIDCSIATLIIVYHDMCLDYSIGTLVIV